MIQNTPNLLEDLGCLHTEQEKNQMGKIFVQRYRLIIQMVLRYHQKLS